MLKALRVLGVTIVLSLLLITPIACKTTSSPNISVGIEWIGTSPNLDGLGGGVSKFDGTHWTTYKTSNSGIADNNIRAIAIDSSGNKWFVTWGGGVSKFNGSKWTTYNTSNSGLVTNTVTSICIEDVGSK